MRKGPLLGILFPSCDADNHLFIQCKVLTFNALALNSANLNITRTPTEVKVTRTGKAVSLILINLLLYEPEAMLRVLNNVFYLMSIPELENTAS